MNRAAISLLNSAARQLRVRMFCSHHLSDHLFLLETHMMGQRVLHLLRVGRKQALGRREGAGGQPRTALLAKGRTVDGEGLPQRPAARGTVNPRETLLLGSKKPSSFGRLLAPPQLVAFPMSSTFAVAAVALAPLAALRNVMFTRLVAARGQAQPQRGAHDRHGFLQCALCGRQHIAFQAVHGSSEFIDRMERGHFDLLGQMRLFNSLS
mmetsp:Transcript_65907/g.144557  ORF Transcript_65907/g.144557 Transcript_65907/m.144557 type:complete len:209 (+) Transcript_65907:35-661(+)